MKKFRFAVLSIGEDGRGFPGSIDAADDVQAQKICDERGKGERVYGVVFAVFGRVDRANDMLREYRGYKGIAPADVPSASELGDASQQAGMIRIVFTFDKRTGRQVWMLEHIPGHGESAPLPLVIE